MSFEPLRPRAEPPHSLCRFVFGKLNMLHPFTMSRGTADGTRNSGATGSTLRVDLPKPLLRWHDRRRQSVQAGHRQGVLFQLVIVRGLLAGCGLASAPKDSARIAGGFASGFSIFRLSISPDGCGVPRDTTAASLIQPPSGSILVGGSLLNWVSSRGSKSGHCGRHRSQPAVGRADERSDPHPLGYRSGRSRAAEQLLPLVYDELRRLAGAETGRGRRWGKRCKRDTSCMRRISAWLGIRPRQRARVEQPRPASLLQLPKRCAGYFVDQARHKQPRKPVATGDGSR